MALHAGCAGLVTRRSSVFSNDDDPTPPAPSKKRCRDRSAGDDLYKENNNGEGSARKKPTRVKPRILRQALTVKAPAGLVQDHASLGGCTHQLLPSAIDPDATPVNEGNVSAFETT
jgi:hypothetical protein